MTQITVSARIFLVGAEFTHLRPGDRVVVVGETIIARADQPEPLSPTFSTEDILAVLDRGPSTRLRIGDALAIDRKDTSARLRVRRILERAERESLVFSRKQAGSGIVWARKAP